MLRRITLLFATIVMIAFGSVFTLDVQAAVFTVSTTTDSGAGSLRQAVADANATPSNDIINFSSSLSGTKRDCAAVVIT